MQTSWKLFLCHDHEEVNDGTCFKQGETACHRVSINFVNQLFLNHMISWNVSHVLLVSQTSKRGCEFIYRIKFIIISYHNQLKLWNNESYRKILKSHWQCCKKWRVSSEYGIRKNGSQLKIVNFITYFCFHTNYFLFVIRLCQSYSSVSSFKQRNFMCVTSLVSKAYLVITLWNNVNNLYKETYTIVSWNWNICSSRKLIKVIFDIGNNQNSR